ncbi:MAG: TIGR03936 family radical SAM-associated protein [Ruminococcus sp.]|nr:TIGR03936 family radical SAM-associated protein [Ruminococcus sp.]
MAQNITPKLSTLQIEKFDYRAVYAKYGRARYISHLDFMRSMQRIIKRSRLPVWHTQGFNPHVYIMFPLALPLGTDSRVEIMDLALTEKLSNEQVRKQLGEKCPEGIEIISVSQPVHKHTEIKYAEYDIKFKPSIPAQECLDKWNGFMSLEKIEIEKRTKKKTVNLVDIKPHITVICAQTQGEQVALQMRLPAGNDFNLNTNVVLDAFFERYGIEFETICTLRTKIALENGESFT